MSDETLISYLRDKVKCQEDQICELREKLIKFHVITVEKDELQSQLNDLKRWVESVEFREKEINNELLNEMNHQSLKLEKAKADYIASRTQISRLLELNENMTSQIDIHKQNEQRLTTDIEELEITQKRIRNELCNAKFQVQEKCSTIESLTETLKCKDYENVNIQRQLDECRMASDQLDEAFKNLEKELECKKLELADAKCHANLMVQNINLEKEEMLQEVKTSYQKFRDKELECDELNCNIDDMKSNVHKLERLVKELQTTCETNRCEIRRLKKENCENDEYASLMKSKIVQLVKDNGCMSLENDELRTQSHVDRCKMEKMKHMTNNVDRLTQENAALLCTVQQQIKKIDFLEEELGCLRKNEREVNNERETCSLHEEIN